MVASLLPEWIRRRKPTHKCQGDMVCLLRRLIIEPFDQRTQLLRVHERKACSCAALSYPPFMGPRQLKWVRYHWPDRDTRPTVRPVPTFCGDSFETSHQYHYCIYACIVVAEVSISSINLICFSKSCLNVKSEHGRLHKRVTHDHMLFLPSNSDRVSKNAHGKTHLA